MKTITYKTSEDFLEAYPDGLPLENRLKSYWQTINFEPTKNSVQRMMATFLYA